MSGGPTFGDNRLTNPRNKVMGVAWNTSRPFLKDYYYRHAEGGDEGDIHRALRDGLSSDRSYAQVAAEVSARITADDGDYYFDPVFVGRRILIRETEQEGYERFQGVFFLDFTKNSTGYRVVVAAYPPVTVNGAVNFQRTCTDLIALFKKMSEGTPKITDVSLDYFLPSGYHLLIIGNPSTQMLPAALAYTFFELPDAPQGSVVAGDGQLAVSWLKPGSAGESYSYDLEYRTETEGEWNNALQHYSKLAYDLTGLKNGQQYRVRVRGRQGRKSKVTQWWQSEAVAPVAPPAPLLAGPLPTVTVDGLTAAILWGAVDGAISYRVFIDGELHGTTLEASYSYTGAAGDHTVALEAVNADNKPGARGDAVSFTLAE